MTLLRLRTEAAYTPAAREKAAREKACREWAAREWAEHEQAARQQAAWERAAREKEQEQAAREEAAHERAARRRAARKKAECKRYLRERSLPGISAAIQRLNAAWYWAEQHGEDNSAQLLASDLAECEWGAIESAKTVRSAFIQEYKKSIKHIQQSGQLPFQNTSSAWKCAKDTALCIFNDHLPLDDLVRTIVFLCLCSATVRTLDRSIYTTRGEDYYYEKFRHDLPSWIALFRENHDSFSHAIMDMWDIPAAKINDSASGMERLISIMQNLLEEMFEAADEMLAPGDTVFHGGSSRKHRAESVPDPPIREKIDYSTWPVRLKKMTQYNCSRGPPSALFGILITGAVLLILILFLDWYQTISTVRNELRLPWGLSDFRVRWDLSELVDFPDLASRGRQANRTCFIFSLPDTHDDEQCIWHAPSVHGEPAVPSPFATHDLEREDVPMPDAGRESDLEALPSILNPTIENPPTTPSLNEYRGILRAEGHRPRRIRPKIYCAECRRDVSGANLARHDIEKHGRPCSCGLPGCKERYVRRQKVWRCLRDLE
ncbi:hypothetical protein F4777DRAFT_582612 [Nemania sp. FL0916]|nr:hypothetical protein F4777DRAFT_582612 [Nemania sp. FL0916]